jgi:GT2 family glycosyltransferase
MINIATILTCYNRREKTVHCLQNLFEAIDAYNAESEYDEPLHTEIFLTDDGCTDGTADAVQQVCRGRELHIVKGNGQCFWAGGMRLAWSEAMKQQEKWQYFLLLNDDTFVNKECFKYLLEAHKYSLSTYGKAGIYSGITCDTQDKSIISYGGYVWTNYLLGKHKILTPTGSPQPCDKANSNIMLVHASVVKSQGIFFEGYTHNAADYDYSIHAVKHGFPVLVTSSVCGTCDYDHFSEEEKKSKLMNMTLKERKAYFNHPLHSMHDTLVYTRRNLPVRYIMCCVGRFLNLYCPRVYYILSDKRCGGKEK